MRPIQINPVVLVSCAVLAAATLLIAADANPPGQSIWPPPRSRILNVFEEPTPGLMLLPNSTHVVLTVPEDRWLTITGASAYSATENIGLLRWVEISADGTVTKKGRVSNGALAQPALPIGSPEATPLASGGPVGWTFAPGSSVALTCGGGTVIVNVYSLIGYYSRL